MSKVALFGKNAQQRWLQFDEDTEVLIEYLSKDAARELNGKVEKIVNRTGAQWDQVWEQKLAETAVKGWRNIYDNTQPGFMLPDGSPFPFTPENRNMIMKSCREFSIFVGQNAIDAKVFMETSGRPAEAAEIKND